MPSRRLRLSARRVLTAAAVTAVVALVPAPAAVAQPADPPTTASEALRQYQELTKQTELVNEDYEQAKADLGQRQLDLRKADADLTKAKGMLERAGRREAAFRGQVDQLADASYRGARLNQLEALFTGSNAQDFLDRSSALSVLASTNAQALEQLQGAVTEAEQGRTLAASAQRRAVTAKLTAQQLVDRIGQKKVALADRIGRVKDAYDRLSTVDRDTLIGGDYDSSLFAAPTGTAGKAMQVALDQIGKPYVWGATGPDSFDCSGLVMYSYAHVGVQLPRTSRQQFQVGTPVGQDQLRPGDLVFFGGSPATIHHVAMYIGQGKIVHASTTGVPVKIATLDGHMGDYYGAKRIVAD